MRRPLETEEVGVPVRCILQILAPGIGTAIGVAISTFTGHWYPMLICLCIGSVLAMMRFADD